MPFKKGQSGNPDGRIKGSKNKFSSVKESFLEAFEKTGGVTGLIAWAKKAENRAYFYGWITKMLPKEINLGSQSDIPLILIRTPGEKKANANKRKQK